MTPALETTGSAGAAQEALRAALYAGLRGQAEPAMVFPEATVSAASLWVASRHWVDFFRLHELRPGDRVVLQWPASPGFAAFLIGAMWEGLSIAVIPPGMTPEESMAFLDARLGLGCGGLAADNAGCPDASDAWRPRRARLEPTPEARLFMRTCGTSGRPGWVAMSSANIWAVLESHRPALVRREDVVLSVLPWFHSFGLIIDLLPALLGAGIIVRESSGGRDPRSILSAAAAFSVSWCSMVPLQTQRLAATEEGLEFLRGLRGGVIGGASASRQLAEAIAGSNLFVGYGQTEASPGVTLGSPGEWIPGAIGRPVGCEVRVDEGGRLHVRGPNVSLGAWTPQGLLRLRSDRWLDTGDLVERRGGELIFLGRVDNNFKLANGRMVNAAELEDEIRRSDPRMIDCAIVTADTFTFRVYAAMKDPHDQADDAAIARILGNLADRLDRVVTLPDHARVRTNKGALDRLALRRDAAGPALERPVAA